ncbi:hypothetical protein [Fundidesulfovibrio putealis]|uniref:hypothetical protein n=1 Tax=Fundidesulfovibrio putealis TaxID=270496 RepID=UPI00041F3B9A|nr:hypothetical protein [Fundidesulfovibrio putealis]
MLNGTLKDEDVNWDTPESLAALLLTSKILDNAAKAEEQKLSTPKGETPGDTNSEKPKT